MRKFDTHSGKFDLGGPVGRQYEFWWLVGGRDGQRVVGPYSGCGEAHIAGYRYFGGSFSVELLPTRSKDCAVAMLKPKLVKRAKN